MTPKVRFAPSPTGLLHVGNLRTALVNWLFARRHDGHFLLRFDDTDPERSRPEFANAIEEDLRWLGLLWDSRAQQSERLDAYAAACERLRAGDRLYACYETPDELEYKRKRQLARGRPPIYDRAALALNAEERRRLEAEGRRPHWRFLLEAGSIVWNDLVRGRVELQADHMSDPVVVRADGTFLYLLPSTVDDVDLVVTHVIRGEEHVANTAVQIQMFRAQGAAPPIFAHLPLLTDIAGRRLSKRLGSMTIGSLRDQGLEAMALNAYLARLGTGELPQPGQSLAELAADFDISRFGRATPKFDEGQLEHLNHQLLRESPFASVAARLDALGLDHADAAFWEAIRGNLQRLGEAACWHEVCFGEIAPVVPDAGFAAHAARLLPEEPWDGGTWDAWTKSIKAATGRKGKELFLPLRLALTGVEHGPELRALLPLIGRRKAERRLLSIGVRRDPATAPVVAAPVVTGAGPMTLHLFNTLAREKQPFMPLDPTRVRMYVCGPTVYDYAHVGNARPAVVFDVLFRLLRHLYGSGHVVYARNITDVDDKIIAAHRTSGEPIAAITERTAAAYHDDIAALGCLAPTHEPRATAHIAEMQAMIARLIASGHAYAADGHVLFDVPSMPDYGALSRRDLDEMIAGARVEVAPYKKNPQDFILWKPSTEADPGWDSPWGRGRPGWHIECSAMSCRYLGETFDIHGGGADLIFPHHENEIAQSVCAHQGRPFARYWLHNGYLMTEGEKMSKSLGNFYTVHDLLAEFPGEAIRLVLLQTHYRQPLDFTKEGVAQAKRTLDRFYVALRGAGGDGAGSLAAADGDPAAAVIDALAEDLNTPRALAVLHERLADLNRAAGEDDKNRAAAALRQAAAPLGLLAQDPEAWLRWQPPDGNAASLSEAEIERLIGERIAARKTRNFAVADRIRATLNEAGVVLEDSAAGTTWRRA